jgi:hypothetical protein
LGDGDDDQNHEESGSEAISTSDATVRDVGEACRVFRAVVAVLLSSPYNVLPGIAPVQLMSRAPTKPSPQMPAAQVPRSWRRLPSGTSGWSMAPR